MGLDLGLAVLDIQVVPTAGKQQLRGYFAKLYAGACTSECYTCPPEGEDIPAKIEIIKNELLAN